MDGWLQFVLGAAFLGGLAGGVHCAAMCGPLIGIACGNRGRSQFSADGGVNAPPTVGTGGPTRWLWQALAYNAGRITSYAFAGALTGAFGAGGLTLRGGASAQQWMLVFMSASLILLAGYVSGIAPFVRGVERVGAVVWRRLEPWSRRLLPASTPARAFGLGVVWGWLPCGMVYLALMAALATADPAHGALVMAAFGLGTLPNLLALAAWTRFLRGGQRGRMARALAAVLIAAVGVAGIARAAHPITMPIGSFWCLQLPGIGWPASSGR